MKTRFKKRPVNEVILLNLELRSIRRALEKFGIFKYELEYFHSAEFHSKYKRLSEEEKLQLATILGTIRGEEIKQYFDNSVLGLL